MINLRKDLTLLALAYLFLMGNAEATTLVIGRVSDNPTATYKELKPIVDYVASKLHDVGITKGSVLIAKDQDEMVNHLQQGKVDWVQKGVFQALIYTKEGVAEIFLRSWRQGVPTYYSVVFSRKDSDIASPKDLKGKRIAFEDRGGTSGFAVPAANLKRLGLDLVELSSPRETPPAGKVGYAFAGNELSIAAWVHKGVTDAGAFNNQDWHKPEHNPEAMKKDMRIIYETKPIPRMVELVRKDLDPRVKARLKEVLLRASEDPAAEEALRAYGPRTSKFDAFVGRAKEELNDAVGLAKYFLEK